MASPTDLKPLCFVLMPFGTKPAGGGAVIDFNAVYKQVIAPAIEAAGMEAIRADEEQGGGIIHKPMFERLVLCEFAVADLTTANANVFYELGVRHAAKPRSTVLIFADGFGGLPFDVAPLRALPYKVGPDGKPQDVAATLGALSDKLKWAKQNENTEQDSPVHQLLEGYPDIAHMKTDVFRERVEYAAKEKARLAEARLTRKPEAVRDVEKSLKQPVPELEAGLAVDLVLSYRAVSAWKDMIRMVEALKPELRNTVLIQEQFALALNRDGQGDRAEQALTNLIAKKGPSSETYGILGRVYKDRWLEAKKAGEAARAQGLLRKAVETYRKGFEADWRDAYPGVNAVTLMQILNPKDPAYAALSPVVRFAVERKIAAGVPDYWDYATRLELAILDRNREGAEAALGDALGVQREGWEVGTTLNNLRLISEARGSGDPDREWVSAIESELDKASKR